MFVLSWIDNFDYDKNFQSAIDTYYEWVLKSNEKQKFNPLVIFMGLDCQSRPVGTELNRCLKKKLQAIKYKNMKSMRKVFDHLFGLFCGNSYETGQNQPE